MISNQRKDKNSVICSKYTQNTYLLLHRNWFLHCHLFLLWEAFWYSTKNTSGDMDFWSYSNIHQWPCHLITSSTNFSLPCCTMSSFSYEVHVSIMVIQLLLTTIIKNLDKISYNILQRFKEPLRYLKFLNQIFFKRYRKHQ